MSYVEKAIYKYVKNIFTSGLKVLFSKKYIFYTIAFILISVTSTIFYLIEKELTSLNIGGIFISVELSVAVTYLIFGLFFSRYPLKFWVGPAFLVAAGGSVLVYYLPKISTFDISPYIAGICYLVWIIVSVFLTFSLSRNFWGNKVLGSVMFLGKQAEEGTILFSGVVFLLSLVNSAMSGYLIYAGIVQLDYFLVIAAAFAIVAIVIVNVIVFSLGKRDDVFYTILAFFYIFASFTLWKLTIYTIRGSPPNDNWGSILAALFFIFYTVSNYGKKIKKIEKGAVDLTEIQEEDVSKKKKRRRKRKAEVVIEEDEKWALLDIPRAIGPLGVLMSIMGLILGYHVTYLQIFGKTDLFAEIFTADFSVNYLIGLKDKFAIIFIPLMLIFFLLSYTWSENYQKYASPILYRFEMLPPFEELVERIDRIKSGEDSWKNYANMIIKEGVKIGMKSTAQKVFVSPTKKVAGAIGGAYSKTKRGVGRLFRRKKKK
ncbi:MAG: hypothetical protein KAS63_05965 [Candidatus Heimdallarchaeota archaeon]|nr:hypothetical protein [Candidatus Heimdallarchaeota archaeon]MCK4954886.1 hypothetical protein [Candidatus Heimdallarchaeota archaeon]